MPEDQTQETEQQESQPSRADDMLALLEEQEAADIEDAAEDDAEEASKATAEADEPEGDEDAAEQEDEPVEAQTTDEDAETDELPADEDEGAEIDEIPAAAHWPNDIKAMYGDVPEEARPMVKSYLQRLDASHSKRMKDLANLQNEIGDVNAVLEPYKGEIARAGMTAPQVVSNLIATQAAMMRDPKGTLETLARQYNVDLTPPDPYAEPDAYVDPQTQAVLNEVQQLRTEFTGYQQAQQTAQANDLQAMVADFQNATDPTTGALKHPHFDEVRLQMGALMQSGAVQDMEEAYHAAVRAHPTLWQEVASRQTTATRTEARRKDDVAKAKRVRNIRGATTEAPAKRPARESQSRKDTLSEEFNRQLEDA